MRNLRVVETLDTGERVWVLLERANKDRLAGYVDRTLEARSMSARDYVAIYSGRVLWFPRVTPEKGHGLGAWSAVTTLRPPKLKVLA